jgi:multiple sugar transport system permease protein
MLPLMAPVLVAISIFTITWAWGDFMGPLIYIDDESLMPLALGVQYLSSTGSDLQAPPWNTVMVGSLLLVVPMIVLYYLGQRYIYEMNIIGGTAGLR